jgi:hypothetical protein
MKYFLSILAFAAVVVGITGGSWNSQLNRPTPLGLATIIIAALTILLSLIVTYRDQKKLAWQNLQRAKVREVAEIELREALYSILRPFALLLQNVSFGLPLRGDAYKGERFEFDEERFLSDPDYLAERLRSSAFRSAWSHFDLRRTPEYPSIFPNSTWAQFFSDMATRGDNMLEATIAKYSAYLESEALLQVHSIQSDDFFRMRLKGLTELVEANKDMAELPVAVTLLSRDEGAEYLQFLEKLEALLRMLPRRAGYKR